MLQINEIYTLDIHEQKIVELVAEMRQSNKEKTGWDTYCAELLLHSIIFHFARDLPWVHRRTVPRKQSSY